MAHAICCMLGAEIVPLSVFLCFGIDSFTETSKLIPTGFLAGFVDYLGCSAYLLVATSVLLLTRSLL